MFFNINSKNNDNLIKIGALLIHAAKIDENYTKHEIEIIKKALIKIGATNENIESIFKAGEEAEMNSVQILDFTKQVKNMSDENKILIVETLWRIIYSNNEADMYESSLMRRLAGLLYVDNKIMGDIKDKIKKENT